MDIPHVDLSTFEDGAPAERAGAARDLDLALRETGFVTLGGAGIAPEMLNRTFAEAQRFFDLPLASKMAVSLKQSPAYHGYSPLSEESLDVEQLPDLKETMNIGVERGPDDALVAAGVPMQGANQWPEDLPGFREAMEAHFAAMSALARRISRFAAAALGLPEDTFAEALRDPMFVLRLLRYPPRGDESLPGQRGAGAHTDYGFLTLLAQDDAGGLEVQTRRGDWVPVPCRPDAFVVNVGDLLQRWTNDRWRSTPHRVTNPEHRERVSLVFFCTPDFRTRVACLPTCQADGEPPRYPPIRAGDHVLDKYRRTFAHDPA